MDLPYAGPCSRMMSANSRVGSGKVYFLSFALRVLRYKLSSGLTVPDTVRTHLGVTGRGVDAAMTEQGLNLADIGTVH